LRLQQLQQPDQQQEAYVSSFDKKGQKTQSLIVEQKLMCPWFGKKHHVPGYSGHIPFLTQHVIGGTYSTGSVTAYEETSKRQPSRGFASADPLPGGGSLDLSLSRTYSVGHERLKRESSLTTLPENFLQQREANSRTQTNPILNRLASRVTPHAHQVLQALRADARGYVAALQVKAALMDLSSVLRLSDLEIREILYQLDKTGAGEVLEHDLESLLNKHKRLLTPPQSENGSDRGQNEQSHVESYFEDQLAGQGADVPRYLPPDSPVRSDAGSRAQEGFQRAAAELQRLGMCFDTARQAFGILDKHASGVLSHAEFLGTLQELGIVFPEDLGVLVLRLLANETPGQVDLKLLVRGVMNHDETMHALAKLNQSSHQMVHQPHQPLLEPCEDGMGDLPSRKDANSIAQRVRAQWRQSYPKPASAAPLRLSHHGGRAIRDTRRNSRVKNHSDHFHCDADVLRPHSSMELRLMEEAGDALARLPVAVMRRPQSQLAVRQKKEYMNGSSLKLGDKEHVRPSFNFTTTYATTFDPLANSSGRIF